MNRRADFLCRSSCHRAYSDARGSLIITVDGRMAAILADNARQPNDARSSLFDHMMAYTGRYRVEGEDTFVVI